MINAEANMKANTDQTVQPMERAGGAAVADLPPALAERLGCIDETVLADLSDVRWELVVKIQDQIEDGVYETDAKLSVAVERMLTDLLADAR